MDIRFCPGLIESLKQLAKENQGERKRGFTRKVLEMLKLPKRDHCYYKGRITSAQLIEVAKLLPDLNLNDRQNFGPTVRDFVEVAKREPRAQFEVYVITEPRDDERFTVEGVWIPSDRQDLIEFILRQGGYPEEVIKSKNYIGIWWD